MIIWSRHLDFLGPGLGDDRASAQLASAAAFRRHRPAHACEGGCRGKALAEAGYGTEDEPVDPRQSIEMFHYLQLNGVPSRLVLYPGEGHGISKPSHMVDYETRELQWFRHYVLGVEDAAGAEPPVPVEP